jgi:hypothetical protein
MLIISRIIFMEVRSRTHLNYKTTTMKLSHLLIASLVGSATLGQAQSSSKTNTAQTKEKPKTETKTKSKTKVEKNKELKSTDIPREPRACPACGRG